MKYKEIRTDKEFFKDIKILLNFAQFCKIPQSYLFNVANGKTVISEKQYSKLKKLKESYLKQNQDFSANSN